MTNEILLQSTMGILGYTEAIAALIIFFLAGWLQSNLRINSNKERTESLIKTFDKYQNDMETRCIDCKKDRADLWRSKADKPAVSELKADFNKTMEDFKSDIKDRLDLIMEILRELQKKIS